MTPDSVTLVAGATQTLTAKAEDASGKQVAGATIVWASSDTTIATVDTIGAVAARAPGTVKIAASSQGVTGFCTVTVTARPVASVTISPNPASVPLNASSILTATLKDTKGDTLAGQTVIWKSSDSTTVSVTTLTGQTQVVTGNKAGAATITATAASGVFGTVVVTVTNPVAFIQVTPNPLKVRTTYTVQAVAQAFDAGSNLLVGVSFAWTTKSAGTTASVGATTGLVRGVAAGSDSVYASAGGKKGGTPATVLTDSVSTVTVTPAAAMITTVQTETLSVALTDSANNPITTAVTWTSVPGGRVNPTTGTSTVVTPQAGDTTSGIVVTATSEGKTGHSTITVGHDPVATITLSPSPDSVAVDSTITLTATLKDAGGTVLTNRPLSWTSSSSAATVAGTTGETQVVTGAGAGTAVITATSADGPSAMDTIKVRDPAVSVTVAATTNTIYASAPGDTSIVTATEHGANGNTVNDQLTWGLTGNVASLTATSNTTQLVIGSDVAAGPTTITATAPSGAHGTHMITVQGHVQTVAVTLSIDPADTLSVTATPPYPASATGTAHLTDTFGNDVTSQRAVTWTTTDPTTVSINSSASASVTVAAGSTITLTAISNNSSTVNITAASPDGAVSPATTITVVP